ncbi:LCP family protein [Ruminococcus sp. 5_1_39BFAA]|uniref:LCP family protein n=1 Tax=Ruminococcus sp. 5_1_39BFAA TaxID=457412 RepID=UPI003567A2A0
MSRPGRKKRTALFVLEIILLLLFIGGLYVYGQINSRLDKIETPVFDESKVVTNVTAPEMTGYTTYALFGIDHRSVNKALGADNSDTMIIASVNNDTKDVKLVSVYRDTLLDIGNDTYTKANAAYAYGGPEQAISMLNTMLDLNITDYATVDFNAMVAAIDALGGLDIPMSYAELVFMNDYCVETSVETGASYTPIELPERPEDIEATLGEYHLNGVQAVSYCRIRYTASLDMGRTERQRRVIQMMVHKAKKAGLTTIFKIMDDVFPLVKTSLSKTAILNMIPTVIGYSIDDTVGFPSKYKFANIKAGSIIVADTLIDNVVELHKFLYGDTEGYIPSQNIQDASNRILEIVGGADTLVDQAPVSEDDTDNGGEVVWQGDGSGNYNYTDYTDYEDPGTGGGDYTDPGTGGGDYTDPGDGTGGGDYTDPGTGGGDYEDPGTGGGDYTDPGTGGGDYTDPGDGTGGGDYTDPGDGGGGDITYEDMTGWDDGYAEPAEAAETAEPTA